MIGKPCPGYVTDWDRNLREQTPRVHDERSKANHVAYNGTLTTIYYPEALLTDRDGGLVDGSQCIYRLFDDFMLRSSSSSPSMPGASSRTGCLGMIPHVFTTAPPDSVLRPAVLATAYAYARNTTNQMAYTIKACESYDESLRQLNNDLLHMTIAMSDATLCAILVMGLYEMITGTESQSFWHSHALGLDALINLRGFEEIKGPQSELLQEVILCQLQRHNLEVMGVPNDIEAQSIGRLNNQRPGSHSIAGTFMVRRAISKAHNAISLASTQPDRTQQLQDAIRDIIVLDKSLDETIFQRLGALRDLNQEEQLLRPSTALEEVSFRNVNTMLRLLLHQCIIQCHERCPKLRDETTNAIFGPDSTSIVRSSMMIANLLDLFLSTLPSIVAPLNQSASSQENNAPKNAGAYFILWPLHILADSPYTSQAQNTAVHDALILIGTKAGLNRAFQIARRLRLKGSIDSSTMSKLPTQSLENPS